MSLIDDYKNGKRYGVEWKAPTIQHMNNLVETVVISEEDSSTARSLSETAKSESSQALTKSTAAESAATSASQNASSALTKSTEALNKSNEALTKSTTAESNSTEALTKATKAEADSSQALSNSQTARTDSAEALEKANSAKSTAEGIDSKAQNALDNSTQALTKAETALEQVTEALGSKVYSNGELLNEVIIAQELGDSESKLISQKVLTEALNSKLSKDEYYYIDVDNPPPGYNACKCDGVTDDRANFEILAEVAKSNSKILRLRSGLTMLMNFDTALTLTDNFKFECEDNSTIKVFQNTINTIDGLFIIGSISGAFLSIANLIIESDVANSSIIYGSLNGSGCRVDIKNIIQRISKTTWNGVLNLTQAGNASNTVRLGNIKLISDGNILSTSAFFRLVADAVTLTNIELVGDIDVSEYVFYPKPNSNNAILVHGKISKQLFDQICQSIKNKTFFIDNIGTNSAMCYLFQYLNTDDFGFIELTDFNVYIKPQAYYITFSIIRAHKSTLDPVFKKGCRFKNISMISDAERSSIHIIADYTFGYCSSLGDSEIADCLYEFENITLIDRSSFTSSSNVGLVTGPGSDYGAFYSYIANSSSSIVYCSTIKFNNCIFKGNRAIFVTYHPYGTSTKITQELTYQGEGLTVTNSKLHLTSTVTQSSGSGKSYLSAGIRSRNGNSSTSYYFFNGIKINRCDLLILLGDSYLPSFVGVLMSNSAYNKLENINMKIINTTASTTGPLWFVSGVDYSSPKNTYKNCKFQITDKAKITDMRVMELADRENIVDNITSNASPIIYNTENTTNILSNINVDESLSLDLWSEDIING